MHEPDLLNGIRFGDYGHDDLTRWATMGRAAPEFEQLVHDALRASFLATAIGPSFGADVAAGLAREEATAVLALCAHGACDPLQREAKRLALAPFLSLDAPYPLRAIARASLRNDAHPGAPRRRVTSLERT